MVASIKQTLKFQEYRKSQYLNLMNASDYGRHRGSVLYGCEVKPVVGTGTQVQITPGALYTSYGTKIFIDLAGEQNLIVDIDADCKIGGKGPLAADNNVQRPLCILIYAQTVQDASVPANMDSPSVLGTAALRFGAALTTYNRSTGQPAMVIEPVEPVNQLEAQPGSEFPHIDTLDASQMNPPEAGGPVTITRNQIPLGFLMIGAAEDGSVPTQLGDGTGAWASGVSFVQFRNPWEATADFLGFDPLLGRSDTAMATGPADGLSALKQNYGSFQVVGTKRAVPTMAPHYGTTMPSDPTVPGVNPWDTTWSNYRVPSFLRDGDPILNSLRRLDYVMRLWMDRTGDQALIGDIQDRVYSELGTMPELAKILWFFTGGDGSTGQLNRNQITWGNPDATPNAASVNQPLKTGVVAHDVIADAATTPFADSHASAIAFLERTIQHLLADLTGVAVPRSMLRASGAWNREATPLQHLTDGPALSRPAGDLSGAANRPVSVLATNHGYLSNEPVYAALGHLAKRIAHGQSNNLLLNPHFAQGDAASNADGAPFAWNVPGGAVWSRTVAAPGTTTVQAPNLTITLAPGDPEGLWQEISTADTGLFLGVAVGATMSATVNAAVTSGGPLLLQVDGYEGAELVFSVRSVPQTASTWFTHSVSWTVTEAVTSVTKLRLSILTSAAGGTFQIGGAWLGVGSADLSPVLDRSEESFLSRKGGRQAGWRGHQLSAGYDLYFGPDYNSSVFGDRSLGGAFGAGPRPVVSGAAVDAFVPDNSAAKQTLSALLARTSATAGPSLLVNSSFRHVPAASGDSGAMPTGWTATGALTWLHEGGSGTLSDTAFMLSANAGIQQVVTMTASALTGIDFVGGLPTVSASVLLSNTGNARLLIESLTDADALVDSAYVDVPISAVIRAVSLSAVFPTTARKLRVTVKDMSGISNTIRTFGVTASAGMAHAAGVDRSDELSLSRYDASNNAMHVDLSMGTHRIRDLANPILDGDAVNKWWLDNELSFIYGTPQNSMVRDYTGAAYTLAWPEVRGRKVRRVYFFLVGGGGGGSSNWIDWPATDIGAYGGVGGRCAAYLDYVEGVDTIEVWVGQGGAHGWGQWGGFGMTGGGGGAATRLVYNGVSYYAGGGAGADGAGFRMSGTAGNGGQNATANSAGSGDQGTAGNGPPDKTMLGGSRSAGPGGATEYNSAVANMLLSSLPPNRGTPMSTAHDHCQNPPAPTMRAGNGVALFAW